MSQATLCTRAIYLFVLMSWVLIVPQLAAQDRRARLDPGLVLETGARHATCDALTFTPDGQVLLAAGDDKVVRQWGVGEDFFSLHTPAVLRWHIYREQRGGIHALALSPDNRWVAIGGKGLKDGLIAVLNRDTGKIDYVMENPRVLQATWAITYSPDGKYIVFGTENGLLYRWNYRAEKAPVVFSQSGAGAQINRIRLIRFTNDRQFISVDRQGAVQKWDVFDTNLKPQSLGRFSLPNLYRVAISSNGRWLAACGEIVRGQPEGETFDIHQVELVDLRRVFQGETFQQAKRSIAIPQVANSSVFPRTLAFCPLGKRLAVGIDVVNQLPNGIPSFSRITDGIVHIYDLDLPKPTLLTRKGLPIGYRVDALAFRPGKPEQLATAGGPNHEVRLWDIKEETNPRHTIPHPGTCIWQVALSDNGKYIAWKDKINRNPHHPNERGTGAWRIFRLDKVGRRIEPFQPADFYVTPPLKSYKGWKVRPTDSSYVWQIVPPQGRPIELNDQSGLYFTPVNQIPRCYTFIPPQGKHPIRVVIGHLWGASVYECLDNNTVRLARILVGHEGEVMSVAASRDGRTLITGGRDQTIAGWSLADWPEQSELGASFTIRNGRVQVNRVIPGSPAWEAELSDGDELIGMSVVDPTAKKGWFYDPEGRMKKDPKTGFYKGQFKYLGKDEWIGPPVRDAAKLSANQTIEQLRQLEPGTQYFFMWKNAQGEQANYTRVFQRPLWRFFPTRPERGNDWVLWRWRDFYYDTLSPKADEYVGWHVNPERLDQTPSFHRLSDFSGLGVKRQTGDSPIGFNRPDKVWETVLGGFIQPDRVIFPDIQPPEVQLTVLQRPTAKQALRVRVQARPREKRDRQSLTQVKLWADDTIVRSFDNLKPEGIDTVIEIPVSDLRPGENEIRLTAFNRAGGRSEALQKVNLNVPVKKGKLYAICVGINEYDKHLTGYKREDGKSLNLLNAKNDATQITRALREHKNSNLYTDVQIELIDETEATAKRIVEEIARVGRFAKREDTFVFFFAGHGFASEENRVGTFRLACRNSDSKIPDSHITADKLREVLGAIKARKLLILDACHSGAVTGSPIRDINTDKVFWMMTACKAEEKSLEEPTIAPNGFFTDGLLHAIGRPSSPNKPSRNRPITLSQIEKDIRSHVSKLVERVNQNPAEPKYTQTPVFFPERLPPVQVFAKP
jgi:WD40 repeat protein